MTPKLQKEVLNKIEIAEEAYMRMVTTEELAKYMQDTGWKWQEGDAEVVVPEWLGILEDGNYIISELVDGIIVWGVLYPMKDPMKGVKNANDN